MEESNSPKPVSETSEVEKATLEDGQRPATPLRCFTGALMAATLSLLAYRLTLSIAATFANKPIVSENPVAVNISAAVRTLVTGIAALGAGVFGVAALGLTALGIQLIFKRDAQSDA
ncbi:DUF3082 domain-containing protein [cf. Phormidesmis sp. LEGE 11477]|uniref:DUF3082 domain-containing protein n=1 Tax=cf. Phormidesmis sp. LEGE 11477 TaxID=1828680 RepID=UPI0018806AB7|nr:DUF3082 domain-containing protein [cf. Phormidesmis sp. LEGE 11477]MBE9063316.1 DUF3082 domain-containing protein [cf. Phormidesmis sp. LEGE 11477]